MPNNNVSNYVYINAGKKIIVKKTPEEVGLRY